MRVCDSEKSISQNTLLVTQLIKPVDSYLFAYSKNSSYS